jgi:hypothetical protein
MTKVVLTTIEAELLCAWYVYHRITGNCNAEVTIEHFPGGGIGTVTKAKCGCGNEIDITDYEAW